MRKSVLLNQYNERIIFHEFSSDGEKLVPRVFTAQGFRDDHIGIHEVCMGFCDFRPVSDTHNVIICRACGRIGNPIPKEIDTKGKLSIWCEKEITEDKKKKELLNMLEKEQNNIVATINDYIYRQNFAKAESEYRARFCLPKE